MAATLPLAPDVTSTRLILDMAEVGRVVLSPGRKFTDDEFLDFCQQHKMLRIERNGEGEVILRAPVGSEGGLREFEIAAELRAWARPNGKGVVLASSAGITLPDGSVFSPDACFIPLERWRAIPPNKRETFAPVVPSFVIELRSRTDRMKDLREKMLSYLQNGVELGWLIDPQSRSVSVYRSGQTEPTELDDPECVLGEGPVEGFVLNLKEIYDRV